MALTQQGFHPRDIGLRVDADRVEVDGFHIQRQTVLQQTQLLKPLRLLQGTGPQCSKAQERLAPVGVQAQVLPVGRVADAVAIVRYGGPGEIQRAPVALTTLTAFGFVMFSGTQGVLTVVASTCGPCAKGRSSASMWAGCSSGSSP